MGKGASTPAAGFSHGVHKKQSGMTKHAGKGGKAVVLTPSNAKSLGKAGK